MDGMKGQVFILGAILFGMMTIMVFLSTGPTLLDPGTNTRLYFQQTLLETSRAFNNGLEKNRSIDSVKIYLYSYDRFLERQAREKGIEYSSYTLAVLPQRGEGIFINFLESSREVNIRVDGEWHNSTVGKKENLQFSFGSGTSSFLVSIPERGESHSFDAATPRFLKHSIMNSTDESWQNTLTG